LALQGFSRRPHRTAGWQTSHISSRARSAGACVKTCRPGLLPAGGGMSKPELAAEPDAGAFISSGFSHAAHAASSFEIVPSSTGDCCILASPGVVAPPRLLEKSLGCAPTLKAKCLYAQDCLGGIARRPAKKKYFEIFSIYNSNIRKNTKYRSIFVFPYYTFFILSDEFCHFLATIGDLY
jgi:hypothetical protein